MSNPVEQESVEQEQGVVKGGRFRGAIRLAAEPLIRSAETDAGGIWEDLLDQFEGKITGRGGRLDITDFWRNRVIWSIVTHMRDDEDAQADWIEAGQETILARLGTSNRRPLRELHQFLYQDLTTGECAGELKKGHTELIRRRVADPETYIAELRERMTNPVYGVRTPHSLVSIFGREYSDFLRVTASQYKQPTNQHDVLSLARKYLLKREDLLEDEEQRDPTVDEAVYYLYGNTILNLPEAALVEAELICRKGEGAKEYLEQFINDLRHSEYGVAGPYNISRAVLMHHNQVLGHLIKRDSKIQARVADQGQAQILAAIKDGKTTSEQAQKLVTVHQEIMTSLSRAPEIWAKEACEDEEGAKDYYEKLVKRLGDSVYGVGGRYDVSDVLITTHGQVLAKVAGRDSQVQAIFFDEGERQVLEALESEDIHPQLGKALLGVYKEAATTLAGASEVRAERACKDLKSAKEFWTDYASRLNSREYGLNGRVNLGEQFNQRKDAVIARVAEMDARSQRIFMRGGAEAIIEFLEGSDKDSEVIRTNPDVRAVLMQDLFELFSDSPIALTMIARDPEGKGGRQATTQEAIQRYLVRYIVGLSLEDEGRHEGLGLEAGEGHRGVISDLGNFISSRSEKKTAAQKTLCHTILTALRENLLLVSEEEELLDSQACRYFEIGFTAAIEHATRLLKGDKGNNFDVLQSLEAVFKNLSPASYATWLCANPALKPSFDQAMRYDHARDKLAKKALQEAAGKSQAEQFCAVVEAAAKLDPTLVYLLPEDPFIQRIQAQAYEGEEEYRKKVKELVDADAEVDAEAGRETKTVDQARTHLVMANKLTGFGDVESGFRPILAGKMSEGMVSEQRLMAVYVNQLIARIQDSDFNNGSERLQSIIAGDLFKLGLMLRNIPGENNELKAEARERFIPLLLDVLTAEEKVRAEPEAELEPEAEEKEPPFHYCQPVREMAKLVHEWCVPYWSKEGLEQFIAAYDERVRTNEPLLVDNNGLFDMMIPLAVRQDNRLPGVEGQHDGIRPVAARFVLEEVLRLVKGWPTLTGATTRRSVMNAAREITTNTPRGNRNLFQQATEMVSWLGGDEEKVQLEEALSQLGVNEVKIRLNTDKRPPIPAGNFIRAGLTIQQVAESVFLESVNRFHHTIAIVSGGLQASLLEIEDGKIIGITESPIVTKVLEDGQAGRIALRGEVNLAEVEGFTKSLMEALTKQVKEGPVDLAETIFAVVEQYRHELDPNHLLEALKSIIAPPMDAEGRVAFGLPERIVSVDVGRGGMFAALGAILATHADAKAAAGESVSQMLDSVFQNDEAMRSLAVSLARESGMMEEASIREGVRTMAMFAIGQVLAEQTNRQGMVERLETQIIEAKTRRLAEVNKLREDAETAEAVLAKRLHGSDEEARNQFLTMLEKGINTQTQAALTAAKSFYDVYPQWAGRLASNALALDRAIFGNIQAFAEWITEILSPDSDFRKEIDEFQAKFAAFGLDVRVEMPDIRGLLTSRGATVIAGYLTEAEPEEEKV